MMIYRNRGASANSNMFLTNFEAVSLDAGCATLNVFNSSFLTEISSVGSWPGLEHQGPAYSEFVGVSICKHKVMAPTKAPYI